MALLNRSFLGWEGCPTKIDVLKKVGNPYSKPSLEDLVVGPWACHGVSIPFLDATRKPKKNTIWGLRNNKLDSETKELLQSKYLGMPMLVPVVSLLSCLHFMLWSSGQSHVTRRVP